MLSLLYPEDRNYDLPIKCLHWTVPILFSWAKAVIAKYRKDQTKINSYTTHNPPTQLHKATIDTLSHWFHSWTNYWPDLCPRCALYRTPRIWPLLAVLLTGLMFYLAVGRQWPQPPCVGVWMVQATRADSRKAFQGLREKKNSSFWL